MHEQTNTITDFVVPIVIAKISMIDSKEEAKYKEQIATGFLIGNNGYILTAGHVIDELLQKESEGYNSLVAFKTLSGHWYSYKILEKEKHPTEDVGILKIEGDHWKPLAKINDSIQQSGIEYFCWGYPRSVTEELKKIFEDGLDNPTIIFSQGHVRRKIYYELQSVIFKGKTFYELSTTVGEGNSGAPMLLKIADWSINASKWEIIGVYIGEKSVGDVGYAVRAEAFSNWTPTILKRTILKEAN